MFWIRNFATAVAVAAALWSGAAQAVDWVDPKTPVTLAPDEGVAMLVLDTPTGFSSVHIDRIGGAFGGRLPGGWGRRVFVFKAPVGRYRWQRFEQEGLRRFWDLRGDDDYTFEIKPGVVNYPGDFEVTPTGSGLAFAWKNRTTKTLAEIDRDYRTAIGGLPFVFNGIVDDPFPAYYRERLARAGRTASQLDELPENFEGEEHDPPLPARDVHRLQGLITAELSPSGRRLARIDFFDGRYSLRIVDLGDGTETVVHTSGEAFDTRWTSEQRLVIETSYGVNVCTLTRHGNGAFVAALTPIPAAGSVLDVIGDAPDQVIFLRRVGTDSDPWQLYRVDVSQKRITAASFQRAKRLDVGLDDDVAWLTDRRGILRAVTVVQDGRNVLLHRAPGEKRFRRVIDVPTGRTLVPLAFGAEGTLVALTDIDRDQRELVEVSLATGTITRTLHAVPGIDLVNVVKRGADDAVVGVRFYRDGQLRTHYFDEGAQSLQSKLESRFPGRAIGIVDGDEAGARAIVATFGPTDPGHLYLYTRDGDAVRELGSFSSHLASYRFIEPRTFVAKSADGFAIESILFLPDSAHAAKAPLVVMPHGGPLGVRDTLSFDADAQYLASRGYAVLKVNYRGSLGYGIKFYEAGYGARGRQIEDDIERAIDQAIAQFPVDPARMCVVGHSYGGYSALMALVRSDRFRCAVAVAAVTDVPLTFTSSDWSSSPAARQAMARVVGDPATAQREQIATSPLYQTQRITEPLLLIHGGRDERVAFEHAERLRLVLTLEGRPPSVLYFPDEGHALGSLDATVRTAVATARFLDMHLKGEARTVDAARADDAAVMVAKQVAPVYPAAALDAGIAGVTRVRVVVRADGTIASTAVEHSAGDASLDDAAIAAVKQWQFRPRRRGGRNVEGEIVVPVKFEVRDEGINVIPLRLR